MVSLYHFLAPSVQPLSVSTWPKAGPSGGEGEAFPAGMYIRRLPTTFAALLAIPREVWERDHHGESGNEATS